MRAFWIVLGMIAWLTCAASIVLAFVLADAYPYISVLCIPAAYVSGGVLLLAGWMCEATRSD